ncbi:hypothetical protein [Absidia glauca]|uniref:WH1 domain-containing protein n=1 Tax=Absidia glauca TaxID=4829 RepID=A0A168S8B5_ABSGL|nr:hypothetical protein [Absidia glauca]
MPATLTLESDKTKVKKAVPTSKILTAAVVRLYVASPDPRQWTYGLWGAAALLKDMKKNNAYFIRIIDIEKEEGTILWEQELYADFQFHQDAPFFYTFDTDDYLAGLEFADQEEGEVFYRKLHRRGTSSNKSGEPEDFTHVSHIGHEREKGFNVHGENDGLVKELQALGISESEIEHNQDFIQEYLQQHGSRRSSASSASKPKSKGRRPPPPPPPRRIKMPSQYTNRSNDRALSPSPIESATPSPDDGNLVSSLANVLNQRKMAMQSDDDSNEEDDEDWD